MPASPAIPVVQRGGREGHALRRLLSVIAAVGPALAAAAPAAAQQQQPPPPPPHEEHLTDTREFPSLRLSGFGDVNFGRSKRPDGPRNFFEGQLALHMASQLSPRVTFFGEISFSPRADAGTGSPAATGFNAEVERMIVRFDRNDRLKVSFGRYHTPINYWNTAFHHGQWLQTTITRPEMIQFGGRFLPVHFVGALVEGAAPAGGWNLNYKAGVGNGRGSVISRAGDAGDANDDLAWLVNLFSKPDAAFGLEFGGAMYGDTVTLPSGRTFGERIVSAYGAWQKEEPEVVGEFAAVRHREAGATDVFWSRAFYLQGAWRLPAFDRLWKPYVRIEHISVDDADAMFATVQPLDGLTLGVRYDLSLHAAAKGEYRTWTRGEGSLRNHGAFLQVCFTF